MKRNKKMYLSVVLILIVGTIAISAPAELTQDIHVLVVSDDADPKTGAQHKMDKDRIVGLMGHSVAIMLEAENPDAIVHIDELLSSNRQLTKDSILRWCRNVNPGTDEVVFVYFSGRGGADKTGAKERFLYVQNDEKLYRTEITPLLERMQCRLKILITEADSVGPPATRPRQTTNTQRVVDFSTTATLTETDALRQLFLEHKGFLNLTSTSLGHLSLENKLMGGYFTTSLMNAIIPDAFEDVDQFPQDDFVSWAEVFEFTKENLNEFYEVNEPTLLPSLKKRLKQLNQTTQVPEVLSEFPTSGSIDADPVVVSVPAARTQDLHVLMVVQDGQPRTGRQHGVDKERIETLMQSSVRSMLAEEGLRATVSIDELLSNDRQLTKANIFGWLQGINPGPDDVVFVYYSGHGFADKTGAKERYIYVEDSEDGKLYRKELVKAMEGLNCRLKILITDISSWGPPPPQTRHSTNTPRFVGVSSDAPLTQTDVLRQLFFEHKGFLNLTATSLGHVAMGQKDEGGYFTLALMKGIFPDEISELDRNPQDGFVSWEEVFELTKGYLNKHYKANESAFSPRLRERLEQLGQTTQTPEVLSDFPKRIR